MMFNQLSLFTTFGIVILISTQCATQVTLTQKSTDVGLGVSDSMELVCSVTGAISSSRTWTGGPGFTPIVSSGVSIDPSKYTETLQTVDFSLHIHNVVEDDVCGVRYQCSNGFSTSQIETIVLNSSIFSYVPKTSEIQVQSEVFDNDKKMTILVNLTKVFPEPTCIAKFGERDITSKLLTNSYNNGNCGLKSSELSISNETYDCSGQLVITCIVGSYTVTAYTGGPSCKSVKSSNDNTGSIVGGVVGGVSVVAVVAGVATIVKKQTRVKNSEGGQSTNENADNGKQKDKNTGNGKQKVKKSKKDQSKKKNLGSGNQKDKIVVPDAVAVEGGEAAAVSVGYIKQEQVEYKDEQNLKNKNASKEEDKEKTTKTEQPKEKTTKTEQPKDNHTDDKEHKDKNSDKDTQKETNDGAAVAEDQITLLSENTS